MAGVMSIYRFPDLQGNDPAGGRMTRAVSRRLIQAAAADSPLTPNSPLTAHTFSTHSPHTCPTPPPLTLSPPRRQHPVKTAPEEGPGRGTHS